MRSNNFSHQLTCSSYKTLETYALNGRADAIRDFITDLFCSLGYAIVNSMTHGILGEFYRSKENVQSLRSYILVLAFLRFQC